MEKIGRKSVLKVDIKSKSFDHHAVIKDLNLNFAEGETVAILGKSGIGKSTLFKIISGLDVEYQGEVVHDQKKINAPVNKIALLLQGSNLLPWLKVHENIKFICGNVSESRIERYLKDVGIISKLNSWPNNLSGGEMSRVGLSVALINHADVILLDEPFSNIDIGIKLEIFKLLRKIKEEHNTVLILTTHNIEDALVLGDRVVVLDGKPCTVVFDSKVEKNNLDKLRKVLTDLLIKQI